MKIFYIICILGLSILLSPIVLADSTVEQPATQDTYIYKNVPNTNNDEAGLFLYEWTNPARSIISWDISGLGTLTDIQSANISLYYWSNIGDPQGRSYCIQELTETQWLENQATWNDRLTSTPWNTAGAEYDVTDKACISMPGPDAWGWLTWNITDLAIRLAITEGKSVLHFMVISPEGGATYSASFHDSEYTDDTAKRPKLGLEYTGISSYNLTTYFHIGIDSLLVNGSSKTNGTVTSINASQLANITSLADSGYIFLNYNGSETDNPYILNMTQDFEIHAYAVTYTLSLSSDLSSVFISQLISLSAYHTYSGSGISGTLITFQVSSDNVTWSNILNQTTSNNGYWFISNGYSIINYAQGESGTWYFRAYFPGDGTYSSITSSSVSIDFQQLSNRGIIYPSDVETNSQNDSYNWNLIIVVALSIFILTIASVFFLRIKSFRG